MWCDPGRHGAWGSEQLQSETRGQGLRTTGEVLELEMQRRGEQKNRGPEAGTQLLCKENCEKAN